MDENPFLASSVPYYPPIFTIDRNAINLQLPSGVWDERRFPSSELRVRNISVDKILALIGGLPQSLYRQGRGDTDFREV
jgi:hypothetical protein